MVYSPKPYVWSGKSATSACTRPVTVKWPGLLWRHVNCSRPAGTNVCGSALGPRAWQAADECVREVALSLSAVSAHRSYSWLMWWLLDNDLEYCGGSCLKELTRTTQNVHQSATSVRYLPSCALCSECSQTLTIACVHDVTINSHFLIYYFFYKLCLMAGSIPMESTLNSVRNSTVHINPLKPSGYYTYRHV
jgi:hypothetical protein